MLNRKLNVGLIGFGSVGSQVYQLLLKEFHDANFDVEVVRIAVKDLQKTRPAGVDLTLLTDDVSTITRDPNIDVVIELAGGVDKAAFIIEAIQQGKHIITANKAMMAAHGQEILAAAKEAGVFVGFEAAVGGAIPVIKLLRGHSLQAIYEVGGVVNGTTNFILSVMEKNPSLTFDAAVKMAQEKGFAEADPSADVDGLDAASKLQILSTIAFGFRTDPKKIYVEGIRNVTAEDLAELRRCGARIKLLAYAGKDKNKVLISVQPVIYAKENDFSRVKGAENCIKIVDTNAGILTLSGEGAGGNPTATAVMSDLSDICKAPSMIALRAQFCAFQQADKNIAYLSEAHRNDNFYVHLQYEDMSIKTVLRLLTEGGFDKKNCRLLSHDDKHAMLIFNYVSKNDITVRIRHINDELTRLGSMVNLSLKSTIMIDAGAAKALRLASRSFDSVLGHKHRKHHHAHGSSRLFADKVPAEQRQNSQHRHHRYSR